MKGKKTGGKDWAPGQSGNPNGRPKLPKELREAMKMKKKDFTKLLIKYLDYDLNQLLEAKESRETKALDRIVISVITNAISKGDERRLDFLMNRIIGKVTEMIEHDVGENLNKALSNRSDDEIKKELKRTLVLLNGTE